MKYRPKIDMKQENHSCCYELESDVPVALFCMYMVCVEGLLGGKVVTDSFICGPL